MATSGAELSAKHDDLDVQVVPDLFGVERHQVVFHDFDVLASAESPAIGESENVGIDGEGGHIKALGHHDTGGLVTDTRECFECFDVHGDFTAVVVDQTIGEADDVFGFSRCQPAGSDVVLDRVDGEFGHGGGRVGIREQGGCDEIDACVRALSGQQDGDEQLKRARVIERYGRVWVVRLQDVGDFLGFGRHERTITGRVKLGVLMTRQLIPLVLLLTVCPSVANAAGFYALDEGIRAIGRAGAFTAGADDLTAQYYNAAALKHQTGSTLMFDLAAVHQAVTFDHKDIPSEPGDETVYNYDPVTNKALPFPVPTFAYGRRLNDKMVVAVGLYTPYAPRYEYDEDGAQRYSLIDATMVQTNIGPSLSYQINEYVTLGFGIAGSYFSVDQSLKSSLNFDASYDPAYDATFLISVVDPFTITSNVGLLVEPPDGRYALGLSFNPATTYTARGSMSGDFSQNILYTGGSGLGKVIDAETASDDDVSLTVTMPAIAKVGFLVRPTDRLEIEADFVWQGWSSLQSFTVTDVQLTVPTTANDDIVVTDDVGLPANMVNAWSVRLGGDYDTSERLTVRSGVFYETSAVPDATRSVFLPDANKFGYGLGASVRASERVTLDFGLSQAFAPTQTITTSLAYQVSVNTLTNAIGTGATVGNGDFGFVTTIAGLGVVVRL